MSAAGNASDWLAEIDQVSRSHAVSSLVHLELSCVMLYAQFSSENLAKIAVENVQAGLVSCRLQTTAKIISRVMFL